MTGRIEGLTHHAGGGEEVTGAVFDMLSLWCLVCEIQQTADYVKEASEAPGLGPGLETTSMCVVVRPLEGVRSPRRASRVKRAAG